MDTNTSLIRGLRVNGSPVKISFSLFVAGQASQAPG